MTDKTVSQHITPTLVWGILLTSLLGVVAFHLPWHNHVVAAFRLNAFDLAEWASLHPTVRAENPSLWSSMLLRLPLLGLGWSIALSANHLRDERWQWIWRGIAVLVVLRLNPPLEFYKGTGGDNEQQLGYLMIGGLVGIGLFFVAKRWLTQIYFPAVLVIWLIIGYASWEGLRRATNVVKSLVLEVDYGGGFYLLIILVVGVIGICSWEITRSYLPQLAQKNEVRDNQLI